MRMTLTTINLKPEHFDLLKLAIAEGLGTSKSAIIRELIEGLRGPLGISEGDLSEDNLSEGSAGVLNKHTLSGTSAEVYKRLAKAREEEQEPSTFVWDGVEYPIAMRDQMFSNVIPMNGAVLKETRNMIDLDD